VVRFFGARAAGVPPETHGPKPPKLEFRNGKTKKRVAKGMQAGKCLTSKPSAIEHTVGRYGAAAKAFQECLEKGGELQWWWAFCDRWRF